MAYYEILPVGKIEISNLSGIGYATPSIVAGNFTTRAQLRAVGGDSLAIGSISLSSSAGVIYVKIANAAADADWYKVTVSNAD